MTNRVLISVLLLILAIASTGDTFVVIVLGVVSIPAVLAVQVLIELVATKVTGKKEGKRIYALIPTFAVSGVILLKLSIWAQPYEVFKLAMGSSMPNSVEEFVYEEDSWTDYIVRFHCKISPNNLNSILDKGKFTKDVTYERLGLDRPSEDIVIREKKIKPIENPVTYSYEIAGVGGCSLHTNANHDRIYVVYATD